MNKFIEIDNYISNNYIEPFQFREKAASFQKVEALYENSYSINIDNIETTFTEHLLNLIDNKELTDPDVYKKAFIDRKLFSKIRNDKYYNPSKKTAISFSIALELSLEETNTLLEKAGYTLSKSSKFDLIIEYFIINKIYNIQEINEALYHYNEPLLSN